MFAHIMVQRHFHGGYISGLENEIIELSSGPPTDAKKDNENIDDSAGI
jgi:hypothetical protein